MSPPGDQSAKSKAEERNTPFAFARPSSGEKTPPSSLPLRLSVAQGGLGLELSRSIELGVATVEELDVALLGVKYPVDLSLGVKQFRSRRGKLRHALVSLDLHELSKHWAALLTELFRGDVSMRLRPIYDDEVGDSLGENETTARLTAIGVSVQCDVGALAFDLVLSAGATPRFVVDAPRAVGGVAERCGQSPLQLTLAALDVGLAGLASGLRGARRTGRTVEISGLASALALAVLPSLGCRLPSVENQVIVGVQPTRRGLQFSLGEGETPLSSTRRGVRLTGLADFSVDADELLARGDLPGARAGYLTILEKAPGHPEVLQQLAELDLSAGDRGESAAAFLQEINDDQLRNMERATRSRFQLSLAFALGLCGRVETSQAERRAALEFEPDSVIFAHLSCALARNEPVGEGRRSLLDRAISRAPFLADPRQLRLFDRLEADDLRGALADAQRLEASAQRTAAKESLCRTVGETLIRRGHLKLGQEWLRKALRLAPSNPSSMILLASSYEGSGQFLRAAELLQVAVRQLDALLIEAADGEREELFQDSERLRQQVAGARLSLAKVLRASNAPIEEVLASLSAVEMRSSSGVEARLMEASLLHESERLGPRDKALSRVIEAVELGWVRRESCQVRVESLLEVFRSSELSEFAKRIFADVHPG